MNFWRFLQLNGSELFVLIGQHVKLVLIAILVAVVIGVPTGILLTRRRALRGPVLGIANIMQTIPSLALFGFLIPLPFIGGIGARTALVALVLYSLLPIIRNTITGILGVEPSVREAAAAIVVTPTAITVATRMPVTITPIANGNSTCRNTCPSVIPIATAASRTLGSTPRIPVIVLRIIGNSE
jgi:osmoprotectant transport system permease protein